MPICIKFFLTRDSFFPKENREGQDRANDFIDIYLNEMEKEETRHPSFHGNHGLQSLEIVLLDLFVAGSDTTSLTINWTILYLLHHPQVQVKLHAELDRVVGRSRFSHLSLKIQAAQEAENCTICVVEKTCCICI